MIQLLHGFLKRGGAAIVLSGVSVKLISMLLLVYLAHALDKEDYSNISYAILSTNLILIVVSGGFSRTFLRYGSLCEDDESLSRLYEVLNSRGLLFSVLMGVTIFPLAGIICSNREFATDYLRVLCALFIIDYTVEMLGSYLRIKYMTRRFAISNFVRSVSTALVAITLVHMFRGMGYVLALILAPIIAYLFISGHRIASPLRINFCATVPEKGLWRFLALVSLSALLSKGIYFIDGIIVGNLIEAPEALADYRVASLLPINLLILPTMFFTSEYVHITKHHSNRSFVLKYLRNYVMLCLLLSAAIIGVSQLFGDIIISTLFGDKYADAAPLFKVLVIGLCGALILRQPFGVLTNASGRAGLNLINGMITLTLSVSLLFVLIDRYGQIGAAVATAITLWVSGLISVLTYFTYVFPKLK